MKAQRARLRHQVRVNAPHPFWWPHDTATVLRVFLESWGVLGILRKFFRFCGDESGQDMVEYTLLFSFITLAAVAVMTTCRTEISDFWTTVTSALSSAVSGAS